MCAPARAEETDALLRYTVATLAYRAGKVLRDAPAHFGDFQAGPGTRTPRQILAHMGDLLDWATALADGRHEWHDSIPMAWPAEVERFLQALTVFDSRLASQQPLNAPPERIFSGPIADALTHTGQLSLLRRLAGSPVRGENYFRANIEVGRLSLEQAPPVREFD